MEALVSDGFHCQPSELLVQSVDLGYYLVSRRRSEAEIKPSVSCFAPGETPPALTLKFLLSKPVLFEVDLDRGEIIPCTAAVVFHSCTSSSRHRKRYAVDLHVSFLAEVVVGMNRAGRTH